MVVDPIAEFWNEFAAAHDLDSAYDAFAFGMDDTGDIEQRRLADELAELVRSGSKRATTSLLTEYENEGEPLPEVGRYAVILDGRRSPVCVIQITGVEVARFGDVDEEFAWTEGEGDRTLDYWRRAHRNFFASMGTHVTDDTMVVLERFAKVWPPDADEV